MKTSKPPTMTSGTQCCKCMPRHDRHRSRRRTDSRLPVCMTVSSLSLSRFMRAALVRNSAAEKKYPKRMEPRRKGLAVATHPGVPGGRIPQLHDQQ